MTWKTSIVTKHGIIIEEFSNETRRITEEYNYDDDSHTINISEDFNLNDIVNKAHRTCPQFNSFTITEDGKDVYFYNNLYYFRMHN